VRVPPTAGWISQSIRVAAMVAHSLLIAFGGPAAAHFAIECAARGAPAQDGDYSGGSLAGACPKVGRGR
jgi:hypothetical protein